MDALELYKRVMDDMVRAGWLRSHIFTEGKGFHLVWSEMGTPRGIFIKGLADDFGLNRADTAPIQFDECCQSGGFVAGAAVIESETVDLWLTLVAELGYGGNETLLQGLVHVCSGWAVDGDTKIQFGG